MSGEWLKQFPLQAQGRSLVNKYGDRYKFAGVNWYGASDGYHVVGGLDAQPLEDICRTVADLGFTVVRLPFSNEMLRTDRVPDGVIDFNLNAGLRGLSPLQVFDRVIDELGKAEVAVVINNHTTIGMWSGGAEANGLWFLEGSLEYTEAAWIDDWIMLAERYQDRPHVVGYDLRNEVRPTTVLTGPGPGWGTGGEQDWCRAAGRCAQALVKLPDCHGIIIVERVCWPQDPLGAMLCPAPPWQLWDVPRSRLMLALHMYAWSGPGAWSPKQFTRGITKALLKARDYVADRSLYGEFTEAQLHEEMDKEWGFCLNQDLCPVWLSEFGGNAQNEREMGWLGRVCRYLELKDADFAYWPLNVGKKAQTNKEENYGLLTNDWQPRWADRRVQALRRLSPRPATKCAALLPMPIHSSENLALPALAPYPWCAPLPGPLVDWAAAELTGASSPGSRSGSRSPLRGFGQRLPPARYMWTAYHGQDADPGEDAATASGDVDEMKRACLWGGLSGFALHQGRAYMRAASAQALQQRLRSGYNQTVLFLAEEVRLCRVRRPDVAEEASPLTPRSSGGSASASSPNPARERQQHSPSAPAAVAAMQAPNLQSGSSHASRSRLGSGYGAGRLCVPSGCNPGGSRTRANSGGYTGDALSPSSPGGASCTGSTDSSGIKLSPSRRACHSDASECEELTLVQIGLEEYPGHDAFESGDHRVLKGVGTDLASCRQLCLEEGFGGFALYGGAAYFRSSSPEVLRRHLKPGKPGSVFYILTVKELGPGCGVPEAAGAKSCREVLHSLLPRLWKADIRPRPSFASCGASEFADGEEIEIGDDDAYPEAPTGYHLTVTELDEEPVRPITMHRQTL